MDPEIVPPLPSESILAVDFGTRRIGLAVGHLPAGVAVPLTTIHLDPGDREPERHVARVARDEGVSRILVGLPLNMDGSAGKAARRARAFGERLGRAAALPVLYADERLTSEAAEDGARSAGRRGRSGRAIDDLAAVVLLQGFLNDEAARRARNRWADPGASS